MDYGSAAEELVGTVERVLPAWVERSVRRLLPDADAAVLARTAEAGRQAVTDVVPRLRALLAGDVDEQRTTPLTILRDAVRYPTEVLREAGVSVAVRDEFAERRFPDDVYDLTPAAFADIDPRLHQLGLEWGAAKAWVHKQRHGRPPGGSP